MTIKQLLVEKICPGEKPAQYLHRVESVHKDFDAVPARMFAFPDLYEVGCPI